MKRLLLLGLAAAMMMALAVPASAITRGGTLDGEDHPYVGLMVADDADGNPMWRCSGALISETVFVTAGHCTFGAARATIWFQSDVQSQLDVNGYPFGGTGYSVDGTAYAHPDYIDAAFYLYDLGVVVLDEPVIVARYANLPTEGLVDTFDSGRNKATVTAVGYGLQAASQNPVKPEKTVAERIRMQADLFVVDTNGVAGIGPIPGSNSMTLSGDSKHGGTCFGDSGGPILQRGTDTITGVNSFGLNGNCAGVGGAFRIDREFELYWIKTFLG